MDIFKRTFKYILNTIHINDIFSENNQIIHIIVISSGGSSGTEEVKRERDKQRERGRGREGERGEGEGDDW